MIDDAFDSSIAVTIGADGVIERVGASEEPATLRLTGQALLPGMINAHSHAFQRGLRGATERFSGETGSFWSWRERMYALAERLDVADLRRICTHAFREMLTRGITTVGEFHYLHHDDSGAGYAFDDVLLESAAEAGIRLVLLNACYRTGGIGQALVGAQRRFDTGGVEGFLAHCQNLGARADARTQTVGLAVHSIRAVPLDDLIEIVRFAERCGWALHMHVEEQPAEIAECIRAYGTTPLRLLLERVDLGPFFTAVHCTHSEAEALRQFVDAGGNVCLCPTTEANLGDGVPNVPLIDQQDGAVCLGSDSNARIDLFEEMRWMEYAQRLVLGQRGVWLGGHGGVAANLWRCATRFGARALGVNAGTISVGRAADLFTIDLHHPTLRDVPVEHLLDAIVFGGDGGLVQRVCVGGKWVV